MEFAKALKAAKQHHHDRTWKYDPNHDAIRYMKKYPVKRQLFLFCWFHWSPNLSTKAAVEAPTPPPQRHGNYLAKFYASFRTVVSWIELEMQEIGISTEVKEDELILSRDGFEESVSLDDEYSRNELSEAVKHLHSNYANHGWCYPEEYAIAKILSMLPWTLSKEIESCLLAVSSSRLLEYYDIYPSWTRPEVVKDDESLWK